MSIINGTPDRVALLERIAAEAQAAFWAKVAEYAPINAAGDFPPDATFDFDNACERAVQSWWLNADDASAKVLDTDVMIEELRRRGVTSLEEE